MAALNWAKVERERKQQYHPRAGALPATERQLDYILGLAVQKGQPKPKLPKTKRGASELIDRLLSLPDAPARAEPTPVEVETAFTARQEMVKELRDTYPPLTPMTVNSLVQLSEAVHDPMGTALFVNEVIGEADFAPEALSDLVPWLLKRFLAFSAA